MFPGLRSVDKGVFCSDYLVQRDVLFLYSFPFPTPEQVNSFVCNNLESLLVNANLDISYDQKDDILNGFLSDFMPSASDFDMVSGETYTLAAYHFSPVRITPRLQGFLQWFIAYSPLLHVSHTHENFSWCFVRPEKNPSVGFVVGRPDDLTIEIFSGFKKDLAADFSGNVLRYLGLCALIEYGSFSHEKSCY